MKTKSSESAFFNRRALIGFGLGAIGLFLGLVAFIALPKQSAWATPAPCTDVAFTNSNGPNGSKFVTMVSHGIGYPSIPCTIYFTVSSTGWPADPTHTYPPTYVYTSPQQVPWGQTRTFRAFGHKDAANPEDSGETDHTVVNGGP
jgi:hypothetical protein